MMSPAIRVDEDVYEVLQRNAQPFIDNPNSVLRRLLGLEPAIGGADPTHQSSPRRQGPRLAVRGVRVARVASDGLLPASEYREAILKALHERGGSAPAADVVAAVGEKLAGRLTPLDLEQISSGPIRWQNRVTWVRFRLVEKGFIDPTAPRGTWKLTQLGSDEAEKG